VGHKYLIALPSGNINNISNCNKFARFIVDVTGGDVKCIGSIQQLIDGDITAAAAGGTVTVYEQNFGPGMW
jgi:hypothetical protein